MSDLIFDWLEVEEENINPQTMSLRMESLESVCKHDNTPFFIGINLR